MLIFVVCALKLVCLPFVLEGRYEGRKGGMEGKGKEGGEREQEGTGGSGREGGGGREGGRERGRGLGGNERRMRETEVFGI